MWDGGIRRVIRSQLIPKDLIGSGRRVTLYNSIICLGILAYSMLVTLFLSERYLPRKELPIQNRLPIRCARDGRKCFTECTQ